MAAEERVMCFERRLLDQAGLFQGLSLDVEKYLPLISTSANLTYRLRSEAETNRLFKQVIPYVVIVKDDRVLHYRRGSGGEETRLHGKFSIGIGGHLSDEDHSLFSEGTLGYFDGMRREVREEVDVEPAEESMVAVINDDSTDVGFVHFGIVHICRVATDKIAGRRKGIQAPEFIPVADAVRKAENYESWSRFCLENIDELLSRAASTRNATA